MNAQSFRAHMVSGFDPMQADMVLQPQQTPLHLAPVGAKAVDLDFDGGQLSSDAGVILLKDIDDHLGLTHDLAAVLSDPRDAPRVQFTLHDLLKQRVFQIAAGYEDANDSNTLRDDPIFKLMLDRLPETGAPLASQPTMSRCENRVSRTELYRMAVVLLNQFIASYDSPPKVIVLDVDDTEDRVHGQQEQARYDGYYGGYCFMPLHLYEGLSGRLITTILKAKRFTGTQMLAVLKRQVTRFHSTRYPAQTWARARRVVIKVEVSEQGVNTRFVVTDMEQARTQVLYQHLYCARGQAENDIKDHKLYLKSDRTACHRFEANQFRLLLHAAAYVLLETLRREVLRTTPWASATMETIQLRLLNLGARVHEVKDRITIALPSSCPVAPVLRRSLTLLACVRLT